MDKYESYDITDEQWKVIEPLMPPEYTGKKGRPRKDNRTMVNGILWINRSGAQWRQLPICTKLGDKPHYTYVFYTLYK